MSDSPSFEYYCYACGRFFEGHVSIWLDGHTYHPECRPTRPSNLRDYLREKLAADGYSGLAGEECGCACDDLAPCGAPNLYLCTPGYMHKCSECPRTPDDCPMEDGPTGAYCITGSRGWPEPGRDDD